MEATVKERKKARPREADSGDDELEQKEFAGMERPRIKEVTNAARHYNRAKRDRMSAGEIESERKQKLIDLMKKHELTDYRDGDIEVSLDTKDSIKVKSSVDQQDGEE